MKAKHGCLNFYIFSAADSLAAKFTLCVIISLVWWKDLITVLKVKVTKMVQNSIAFLSVLFFLYHWYLCNQPRFLDELLLRTRPCARGRPGV